jgi:quinoprotein glucose dehydrogenase
MKFVASVVCVLALAGSALAQTAGASAGAYSKAQADRGKTAYTDHCSTCHGDAMEGADVIPPLSGTRFMSNWKGQSVGDLVTRIRNTMPADDPGALGQAASTDVTAYILQFNGYPAGEADLPASSSVQGQIAIDAK